MATNQDYIPVEEEKFDTFQSNLFTYISAHQPGTANPWGYPQQRVNTLGSLKGAWDAAWAVAKNKGNRTAGDVQAKDDARDLYEPEIRQFVKEFLKNNLLITNEERVEMGIPVPDTDSGPVPVPVTVPAIEMESGAGSQIVIHFKPFPETPGSDSKGKPKGISRMEIVYKIGTPAPQNPDECNKFDSATRTPKRIDFNPADSGKRVYFFFRWVNTRNQPGPWTDEADSIVIP